VVGTFTLDLYQPSFDFPLPDDSLLDNSVFQAHWPERAWYLQHQTKLNEKLGISAGVRASHTTFDGAIPSLSRRTLDARDTSTSLGLTWQATPTWQWFASHNESFSPNLGWDRRGNLFAPEQSVQHETGIRYTQESLAGRPLQANLSTYRIDRKNVTTADPVNPAYSVLTGAMRSEGIEATLQTPLTPKLNLSAGYNYGDVRITESNSGLKGNRLHNTPRHSGSLQLTYAPSATSELSLGAVHVGKRPGDNANSFEVPAYTRLDAAAQWKLDKHTTLTAGVRNLLDEDYVASSAASNSLVQGRKRSVTLGLEVAF
jgi:iron complex outermembrane receptor protein